MKKPSTPGIPSVSLNHRRLADFQLSDLESIRLLLRGGSVIDWHRLNFESDEAVHEFIGVQEFDLTRDDDAARLVAIKSDAINYLRRNFGLPVPKPVEDAPIPELIKLASSKGHRQMCACTILKVMHIIHHLEARELLFMLPVSTQDVFHWVEQKVYRVVGSMLASGLPIQEFIGGRKHKDSLYTKLLSKQETLAAQIYDKLRFRIVTRNREDILTVLQCLTTHLFPFNYVIPGQSTSTLVNFDEISQGHKHLSKLYPQLQSAPDAELTPIYTDNRFSGRNYRVVNFVVDMPVALSDEILKNAPAEVRALGRVVFAQVEFQIIDRQAEQLNETGEASHDAYKQRQRDAVMRRLKLGIQLENPRNSDDAL